MSPKSDNFDRFNVFENLINEAVLNIDAAGIGASQVPDKFLERWWVLKRVLLKDLQ